MMTKRYLIIALLLLVALVGILAACAAPAPTSTPTSTPTITPTTTPTGALAEVIAGAKKEGSVTVKLTSTFTPKSMERMQREMKQMFGVDLDIVFVPTASYAKDLADALLEHQAGATPSWSLLSSNSNTIALATQAGIVEPVDFKPLITQDTNPEAVIQHPALRGAIAYFTTHQGIMYNPEKVPADQVPMTFSDLANPKWRGKVGLLNTSEAYARQAFIIGKDKVVADLRAIMINKPLVGRYADEYNRYLLGEVWMCFITSKYVTQAQATGMPAAFQSLDFATPEPKSVVLLKRAPQPNAAKLVALYLASPQGAKFVQDEAQSGNYLYPGNFEYDTRMQSKKQGIVEYSIETYPGLLEFVLSDEFQQYLKEIDLILKGAA